MAWIELSCRQRECRPFASTLGTYWEARTLASIATSASDRMAEVHAEATECEMKSKCLVPALGRDVVFLETVPARCKILKPALCDATCASSASSRLRALPSTSWSFFSPQADSGPRWLVLLWVLNLYTHAYKSLYTHAHTSV